VGALDVQRIVAVRRHPPANIGSTVGSPDASDTIFGWWRTCNAVSFAAVGGVENQRHSLWHVTVMGLPDVSNVVQNVWSRRSNGRTAHPARVGATDCRTSASDCPGSDRFLRTCGPSGHLIRLTWAPFGPCSDAPWRGPYFRRAGEPASVGVIRPPFYRALRV
jgi:hypothetical protein